jgi:hypothetical protein
MAGNVFALNLGEDGTGNWQVFMGSAGDHSWKSLEKTFGQWFGTLLQGGHDAWYHPDIYRKMKSLETVKPVTASQAWHRKEGGIWVPADVEVLPITEALAAPPADGEADPEAARKEAAAAIADLVPEPESGAEAEEAAAEEAAAEKAAAEEAAAEEATAEEGAAEEAAVAAEAADEPGAEPEVDGPPN